jgi:three-Cys-motif partner protein
MADKPVFAADGLIARGSGSWAREKLNYLRRYMDIMTTSMTGKWAGLVFMDLMAGPGVCVDRTDRTEFPGSPLIALGTRKPWTKVCAVEVDPTLRAALEQRVAKEARASLAEVIAGDANSAGIISRLRDASERMLALAFIDLIGQEIAFETVRALSRDRSIDLWFSFPEYDLRRNATLAPRDDDQGARWTRFFGTDEWKPIVMERRPGHAVVNLRRLYERQLEGLGYLTEWSRLPMTNSRGKSLYRPLFASKDPRGIDFFRKALSTKPDADKPPSLADFW